MTFLALFFLGQWLLPGVVNWVAGRATAGWAVSGLAKLRDDGAWALAGLAATGVLTAGVLLRPKPAQRDSGSPRPSGQVLFGEIPHRAWSFQERPELMAQVSRALDDRSAAALVALPGMRGAGKSQLAAQVARRCVAEGYDLVAWIDAESGIVPGLALLGREGLGLDSDGLTSEEVAAAVRRELERADGDWRLVVFDNVEDPAELVRYLPSAGMAQVVITTNRQAVATLPGVASVEVGVFQPEQGCAFLAQATGLPDSDDAQRLGEHLGWLPLGLAQAAAYIRTDRLSYSQYLGLLPQVKLDEVLRQQAGAEHPGVLKATELSLAALRRDDPTGHANQLLTVLSLLSPDGISRHLLTGPTAAAFAPARRWWRPWQRGHLFDTKRALTALTGRSIVTISAASVDDEDRAVVVVHRLIAAVVRYQASVDGSLGDAVTTATRLLDQLTAALTVDQHAHRRSELDELVGHIESVRRHVAQPSPLLLTQRTWAGWALLEVGDLVRGEQILKATAADHLRVLGPDHPNTLGSHSNLAYACQLAGRLEEATTLFTQVVADGERVFGPDHPYMVTYRNNLASAYRSAGRLNEAINLYTQVIADGQRMFGRDHPDMLAISDNLARAYRLTGRLDEAITLHTEVVANGRRVLGSDHPQMLNYRDNLAGTYRSVGRLEEAITLYSQVIADRIRVVGPDHPATLGSRGGLAGTYESAGRLEEAINLYTQVVADSERVLGLGHRYTLLFRDDLARVHRLVGRPDAAITGAS